MFSGGAAIGVYPLNGMRMSPKAITEAECKDSCCKEHGFATAPVWKIPQFVEFHAWYVPCDGSRGSGHACHPLYPNA